MFILDVAETYPTFIAEPTAALLAQANGDPELALRGYSCRQQLWAMVGGATLGLPGGIATVLAAPTAVILNSYRKARLAFGIAHLRNYPTGDPTVRKRVCRAAGLPDSFAQRAFHGAYEECCKEGVKHGTKEFFHWLEKRAPDFACELAKALGVKTTDQALKRVVPVVGGLVGGVMDWREANHCAKEACRLFPPQ